MNILVFALVAAILVFIVCWIVDEVGVPGRLNMIIKVVAGLIALIAIAQRLGVV